MLEMKPMLDTAAPSLSSETLSTNGPFSTDAVPSIRRAPEGPGLVAHENIADEGVLSGRALDGPTGCRRLVADEGAAVERCWARPFEVEKSFQVPRPHDRTCASDLSGVGHEAHVDEDEDDPGATDEDGPSRDFGGVAGEGNPRRVDVCRQAVEGGEIFPASAARVVHEGGGSVDEEGGASEIVHGVENG